MCQLQRTIRSFDFPLLVLPHHDRPSIDLPPIPSDLSLYCHYCGHDAIALGTDDYAVCEHCYSATTNWCDNCGNTYVTHYCENCHTCCEHCDEVILQEDAIS